MASTPQALAVRDAVDFRAPPPSPIAGSRRTSSVANDDVLADFLQQSLHVPELVLPDCLFPRLLREADVVPTVDFLSLAESSEVARDALVRTGCFQLINHGVSADILRAAAGIFRLPTENKKALQRSARGFGFEEVVVASEGDDDDVIDLCEEFVWCNDSGLSFKMQQFWPNAYSNFSDQMKRLSSAVEDISGAIIKALIKLDEKPYNIATRGQGLNDSSGSVCYIYKHPTDIPVEQCMNSLRYDVVRMMIQGPDCPHALSLHLCGEGCLEFHVYSKKGWVSFTPNENALVVTAGDHIQAWIGGQYKHVIGRPIYRGKQLGISMAFLCSPCTSSSSTQFKEVEQEEKLITLHQQALFAVLFTVACQFLLFLYHKF